MELQRVDTQSDELRDTQAARERQEQHGAIADSEARRGVGRVEEQALLLDSKMPDDVGVGPLRGDGADASDLIERRRYTVLDEPHERADRGQSCVARTRGVVPVLLEMLEELEHERRIERFEDDVGGCHAELAAHELEEELECVSIGVAGVRAGLQVHGEPLLEERGDVRCDRRHRAPPSRNRSQASAIPCRRSGVACRYQHVSAGLPWPR